MKRKHEGNSNLIKCWRDWPLPKCCKELLGLLVGSWDCLCQLLGLLVGCWDCLCQLLGLLVGCWDCLCQLLGLLVGCWDCWLVAKIACVSCWDCLCQLLGLLIGCLDCLCLLLGLFFGCWDWLCQPLGLLVSASGTACVSCWNCLCQLLGLLVGFYLYWYDWKFSVKFIVFPQHVFFYFFVNLPQIETEYMKYIFNRVNIISNIRMTSFGHIIFMCI